MPEQHKCATVNRHYNKYLYRAGIRFWVKAIEKKNYKGSWSGTTLNLWIYKCNLIPSLVENFFLICNTLNALCMVWICMSRMHLYIQNINRIKIVIRFVPAKHLQIKRYNSKRRFSLILLLTDYFLFVWKNGKKRKKNDGNDMVGNESPCFCYYNRL